MVCMALDHAAGNDANTILAHKLHRHTAQKQEQQQQQRSHIEQQTDKSVVTLTLILLQPREQLVT